MDCQTLISAGNAASYLSKYIAKDLQGSFYRKLLGFSRAWSRSRNWPVSDLQLRITYEGEKGGEGWKRVKFGHAPREVIALMPVGSSSVHDYWEHRSGDDNPLSEMVGTDLSKWFGDRNKLQASKTRYERARRLIE